MTKIYLSKYFLIALLFIVTGSTSLSSQPQLKETIPGTEASFQLMLIPAGSFTAEDGKKISVDAFYMSEFEVTNDLYMIFRRKELDNNESNLSTNYKPDAVTRPSPPYEDMSWGMGKGEVFPAVSMTQQAALEFCRWLYLKTGRFYRLPTEAEFTYVSITGALSDEPLSEQAWAAENGKNKYHAVGKLKPNKYGIYDLYGNLLEWTADSWNTTPYTDGNNNPWAIPTKRNYRVLKGGSFIDRESDITPHARFKSELKWQERDPQIPKSKWWLTDGSHIGFRVVSPEKQPTKKEIDAFFEKAIVY